MEYEGAVTHLNTAPLTSAALAGILRPLLAEINMVSAPAILKERGTPFTEAKRELSPTYDSLMRVKIQTGGKWRTLAGTLVGGHPKIVEVKSMELDAHFHPLMLFVNNADKPGFIGALGTMLGQAGVNIATFHLGREEEGQDAIAMVGIDSDVPDEVMAQLKAIPQVRYVKVLRF
ncbi:MAG: ACT domain-containing protein [Pseudomonadota bacterium]